MNQTEQMESPSLVTPGPVDSSGGVSPGAGFDPYLANLIKEFEERQRLVEVAAHPVSTPPPPKSPTAVAQAPRRSTERETIRRDRPRFNFD